MKSRGLEPSRETYQCFILRYCQEGNIDGASSTLQTMKQKGFGVNENIFNSLIMGHSQAGDMPRAHGMIKVGLSKVDYRIYKLNYKNYRI